VRRISNKEIFAEVDACSDKERVQKVYAPHEEINAIAREGGDVHPLGLSDEILERLIFSETEAASINGCMCIDDMEEFGRKLIEIGKEVISREDVSPPPEYFERVRELAGEFFAQNKCHMEKDIPGFICFCDEHDHS